MDFNNTTANPSFVYGFINQTQYIDYAHDYSRIKLSPLWYPNTWNLGTGYTSAVNASRRVYDFGSMSDFLAGICSVTDLTDVIDTSDVVAKDLNDEDIIVEDIGNLIG